MYQQPDGTLEHALEMGLTEDEYQSVLKILGRTPNYTELSIFSVMWSEHCSYKNSILEIKKLPRGGERCLVEAGEENAGLIDIGDGLALAFKIESHNHPSAVEPYQGAATGVGGIMRDIFTMGARPLAALNSLRFGQLADQPRNQYLFENVVKGIGDYGNCLGIPTIAGEVYFEECYTDNPLVNAMTLGVMPTDQMASATAGTELNPVFIIGSTTGRDGIHGATFASVELTDESESKKSSVQVGDPFMEKLLLEATLEMIESDILIGIQDMGAAGITCSTSEMSAKSGAGMRIDLDKIPLRESGMHPFEIMLSESQERMLAVVKKGNEDRIREICEKWEILCEEVGIVTDDGHVRIFQNDEEVAVVPAHDLVLGGGAPQYKRDVKKPDYIDAAHAFDLTVLPDTDPGDDFSRLLRSLNIVSRKWIYHQFDTQVRTNTVVLPGGDASVIRIKDSDKGIAAKIDCNARYVYLNPNRGAQIAVAEAARNVACTGAEPLAITNNLNFGNPYNPEMYYLFQQAVDGIRIACEAFNTPVTGGNVSFYNESENMAVYPTPTIGMVGLLDDYQNAVTSFFKQAGDLVYLIGADTVDERGGSEWLKVIHNKVSGDCPEINLETEKHLHIWLKQAATAKQLQSAHDCADGGLAIALFESAVCGPDVFGMDATIQSELDATALFFSETQSRIIISVKPENRAHVETTLNATGLKWQMIGTVQRQNSLRINEITLSEDLGADSMTHQSTLGNFFKR